MKKTVLLFLVLMSLVSFCSCGEKPQKEPVTLFPEAMESVTQTEEKRDVKVNDTYDEVLFEITEQDSSEKVAVLDDSADYRTTDSYKFERQATERAVEEFKKATERYKDVKIHGVSVFDCMDDGDSVYYSFSVRHSYTVESGGKIDNTFFCDVGIRKSDESAFDASPYIYDVTNGYSVFVVRTDKNAYAELPCDGDDSVKESVQSFAEERLKKPDTAQFFSVTETDDGLYEVICSGENSYGLIIKDSVQIKAQYFAEEGVLRLSY